MNHTPGPWTMTEEFGHCQRAINYPDARDHALAVLQAGDPDELLANARLIAASPDLLGALIRCVEALEARMPHASMLPDARAAIAKATGE